MSNRDDCLEVGRLLPELAVGAAAGHERGWALAHTARCPDCRRELGQLTATVDAVLLLAPSTDPPPGFESAALARLPDRDTPTRPGEPAIAGPRSRVTRRLIAALAAALAVLVGFGGGAVLAQWRGAEDRKLADQYRRTLAVADGRYLEAAPLVGADQQRVGTTYLYQGNPSWLLVTVTAAPSEGTYAVLAIDRSGGAHQLGSCPIADRAGTAGFQLPLRVAEVSQVQLRSTSGTVLVVLTAALR